MQKTLDNLLKIFISVAFFVSPLFFFTDVTRNPYIIQDAISVFAALGIIVLLLLKFLKQKQSVFAYSKADIALIVFICIAFLSLLTGSFTSPTPLAIINEFWRRGFYLITSLFAAYFIARLIANKNIGELKKDFLQTDCEAYKAGYSLFIWGLGWLFFKYFKINYPKFFYVYISLMWASGIYITIHLLKQITLRNILEVMIATCALASFYGIFQYLGYDFIWIKKIGHEFKGLSISTFGNPNTFCAFIILFLPILFVFFLIAKKKVAKAYYLIIFLASFFCLFIAKSRSSWLAAIAAFCVLLTNKTLFGILLRHKKKLIFALILFGVLIFLGPVSHKKDIKNLSITNILSHTNNLTFNIERKDLNQSYHQRLMAYTCGIENFAKKPLLGWGWGSWQLTYAPCQGRLIKQYPVLQDMLTQSNAAHNIVIEILSQSGLLGLIAFVGFLFFIFQSFWGFYKKEEQPELKMLYIAVLASCVAFFVDSLLNVAYQLQINNFMWAFLLGVLASLKIKKISFNRRVIIPFIIFLTLIFCFAGLKQIKHVYSAFHSFKGFKIVKIDAKKAKEYFEKIYPKDYPDGLYAYTQCLYRLQLFDEMDKALDIGLTYLPFYYEFYFPKVVTYQLKNQPELALYYVQRGIDLYPHYLYAFELMRDLFVKYKQLRTLDNASYIEQTRIPLPFENAYNLILAQIYLEHGLYEKARSLILTELTKNKFDENARKQLIWLNEKLKIKQDPILAEVNELIALRKQVLSSQKIDKNLLNKLKKIAVKGDLDASMLLAQAYFINQDYEKSRQILEGLYVKYYDSMPLNFALASLEKETKNPMMAKKYLQNILAKDKENQLAISRLKELN